MPIYRLPSPLLKTSKSSVADHDYLHNPVVRGDNTVQQNKPNNSRGASVGKSQGEGGVLSVPKGSLMQNNPVGPVQYSRTLAEQHSTYRSGRYNDVISHSLISTVDGLHDVISASQPSSDARDWESVIEREIREQREKEREYATLRSNSSHAPLHPPSPYLPNTPPPSNQRHSTAEQKMKAWGGTGPGGAPPDVITFGGKGQDGRMDVSTVDSAGGGDHVGVSGIGGTGSGVPPGVSTLPVSGWSSRHGTRTVTGAELSRTGPGSLPSPQPTPAGLTRPGSLPSTQPTTVLLSGPARRGPASRTSSSSSSSSISRPSTFLALQNNSSNIDSIVTGLDRGTGGRNPEVLYVDKTQVVRSSARTLSATTTTSGRKWDTHLPRAKSADDPTRGFSSHKDPSKVSRLNVEPSETVAGFGVRQQLNGASSSGRQGGLVGAGFTDELTISAINKASGCGASGNGAAGKLSSTPHSGGNSACGSEGSSSRSIGAAVKIRELVNETGTALKLTSFEPLLEETPIQKEIRLYRQREGSLRRRVQGSAAGYSLPQPQQRLTRSADPFRNGKEQEPDGVIVVEISGRRAASVDRHLSTESRPDGQLYDSRGHGLEEDISMDPSLRRLAANRIRQEILEDRAREKDLSSTKQQQQPQQQYQQQQQQHEKQPYEKQGRDIATIHRRDINVAKSANSFHSRPSPGFQKMTPDVEYGRLVAGRLTPPQRWPVTGRSEPAVAVPRMTMERGVVERGGGVDLGKGWVRGGEASVGGQSKSVSWGTSAEEIIEREVEELKQRELELAEQRRQQQLVKTR